MATRITRLLLGINRTLRRRKDEVWTDAQGAIAAATKRLREGGVVECRACGIRSARHDLGHRDNNHYNNSPANFGAECPLCHGYGHIGEVTSSQSRGEGLGQDSLIGWIPELSPTDLNLLQRILGMALNDPHERGNATQVMRQLESRARDAAQGFGSMRPPDFAEAMALMVDGEYGMRGVQDLRVLYSPRLLKELAEDLAGNYGHPVTAGWPARTASIRARMRDTAAQAQ